MLLAIDTSTNLASVALVDATVGTRTDDADAGGSAGATSEAGSGASATAPPRLLVELTWDVGTRHSVELLERIEWLLASRGATMTQLTALAVATGPGSFNGARVAVTTAKSLAFALRLPVVAIPTLDVIAWGVGALGPRWALLEAGRGEVYAARYPAPPDAAFAHALAAWGPMAIAEDNVARQERAPIAGVTGAANASIAAGARAVGQSDGAGDTDAPHAATRYHVLTPQQLAALVTREAETASVGAPLLLCGEWRVATQTALAVALAAEGVAARFDTTPRRAWSLAPLAQARLVTGIGVINVMADNADSKGNIDTENLAALEPLYLRRPAITTSAKRALRS